MKKVDKKVNVKSANNPSQMKIKLNSGEDTNQFAENIINTIREPLIVLDHDLKVVTASRSFYDFFKVNPEETIGTLIYNLGNHQWDIPKLKELLETILPEQTSFDNYEVEHIFTTIGKRTMLLNARQIKRALGKEKIILLAIEDITERRGVEKSLSEKSRLTDEYLNILLDHAHAPIIIWDSSFIIKRINNCFEKLSGYNSDELQDEKLDILFQKNKIDSTLEILKNNIGNEDSEVIEIDVLTKDNRIKTVLWNSANILDKDEKHIVATIAQDITSRKLTEEALTILETRYRRLFESAKDGILILNAETGKIIDVNPFLIELLGYSKQEFIEKEIWEIGFFKDIAANKEKFLELQQEEYVRYEDLPLETADGRRINVEFVSNVYKVNRNEVIQCNIRDITERIQTKKRWVFVASILSILNRPNDWKLLVKNILEEIKKFTGVEAAAIRFKEDDDFPYYETNGFSADFVDREKLLCEKKLNGNVIYDIDGNPILKCMCGNIICGRTDPSLPFFTQRGSFWTNSSSELLVSTSEKDRQAYTQNQCNMAGYESVALISLHSGDEVLGLLQLNDKRTNIFTLELIQTMEEIGATIGIAFKRMAIEKQIKESEEKYRVITENSADAIFIMDDHGNYVYVNQTASSLLGYTKEELISMNIKDLSPPDEVEKYIKYFRQLANKRSLFEEISLKNMDGIFVHVDLNAVLLPNGLIYGSCRDITERKIGEQNLIEAKEKAEQTNKMKSEFLAQMSHEIRTPLHIIAGFTSILREEYLPQELDYAQDIFDGIENAGSRIIRTVDLILNMSEVQLGSYDPIMREINLNDVISKLQREYSKIAKDKKMQILFTPDNVYGKILGDEYSITQIFANLIDNAIKYSQSGNIEINYLPSSNGDLVVNVKDTGIGISTEYLAKIFEPFTQEDSGYSRSFDGSGLGLALVKKYCDINSAKITVESKKGIGSTFSVTFKGIKRG